MPFKTCSLCHKTWDSRDSFLGCPDIEIIGYQACLDQPNEGIFLFNHNVSDCHSTIAVEVCEFLDLYAGPIYPAANTDLPGCGGHCHHVNDLSPCVAKCAYAHIRAIVQVLKIKNAKLLKVNSNQI
jgi:hypothetical protein